jgi:hypothetical protein
MMRQRREPLPHNAQNGSTVAVERVWWRGQPFVAKTIGFRTEGVVPHWRPSRDERAWNFWRREELVYRTDLPGRLGLAAPQLLDVVESKGNVTLHLEAVEGRAESALTVADLAGLAYGLGCSQGRADQPDDPWLSRGFLRDYTTSRPFDRELLTDDAAWTDDVIADHLAPIRNQLIALHRDRDRFFDIIERSPQAVHHLDCWLHNVIVRPDGETVLVDWSFTGWGAIGEDVSNLVLDATPDLVMPVDVLPELDDAVFTSYVRGLRDVGWRGDERVVRLGMCAAAVKYEWLASVELMRAQLPADTPVLAYGVPTDRTRLVAARAGMLAFVCRYADEARRLIDG